MNTTVLKERLANLDSVFSGAGRKDDGPSRALVLDLSDESFYDWEIPEQFLEAYVAGPALGARLWAEFAGADVEEESTYESNNPVVLTVSSLSNSGMPGCESLSIAFRSPVSGTLRFNVVSNTFGMRLHGMGYAALIITGRLRRPAVIDIRKSGVVYNISEAFIGFTVSQVEQLVKTGPMTTAMSIGPAGEQKVPFAAVVSEGAVTGRGGLGCVFGYKNIKALCITGFETSFIRRGNPEDVSKALEKLSKILGDSPYCKAMQRGGSSSLVKLSSKNGWAPVFNFSRRTDPRLFHLGGDEVARRYGQNHGGCIGCPVLCRHRTRDGITVPDYDAVLMLGANIACFDMDKIIERYALCLDLGLDPVSTGNVLGWANEAWIRRKANLFEPGFSFKDNSKVLPLIDMIARRTGIGEPLSYGTSALGKACGDSAFAFTVNGLECGPFDYRGAYGQALTDAMGLWFDDYFGVHSSVCRRDNADWAVLNERIVMGLESLGVSPALIVPTMIDSDKKLKRLLSILPKSAIKHVKPHLLAETISAIKGFHVNAEEILNLGDRCWRLIYETDRALGFDMLRDTGNIIPQHFCIDPESNHKTDSILPFRELVDRYCFLRKQTIAVQGSGLNAD